MNITDFYRVRNIATRKFAYKDVYTYLEVNTAEAPIYSLRIAKKLLNYASNRGKKFYGNDVNYLGYELVKTPIEQLLLSNDDIRKAKQLSESKNVDFQQAKNIIRLRKIRKFDDYAIYNLGL